MSDYSFTHDVEVRYHDLDPMGHVNNAVYASYFEQARIAYFEEVLDVPVDEIESVLANLEIDFRRPVEMDHDVTVALRVPELGETSIPMEYEVRADGAVAATGETVQVAVDGETKSSRPIPDSWREQIRTFEGL
ncbi:acyl-CoA thioesterase [Halorussus limi]|uniref:Acyl-CoA thioesterase n=1 Tax=Halorussus limi TaxID=2938695 RepID=A0A8U0HUM4_9EURY|nr:thioesterase family protein [Halorussus limi]UPV74720.1 acyl-CoA thioesterase [Halorussus limi]